MKMHHGASLLAVAVVLAIVALFALGFLVAPDVRSVVAGPDSAPAASPPNPGHSWSEIGDLPGTMWHSNNDGSGSGLDADMVDGMDTGQSGTSYIPYADASGNVGIGTTDPQATLDVNGAVRAGGWRDLGDLGGGAGPLAVWNDGLCAHSGAGRVKCYDGSAWDDLGDVGQNVGGLTVWNGMLCEGNYDDDVWCYNGVSWQYKGTPGYDIRAMATWNNKLCEGNVNDYEYVECYDGISWTDLNYPELPTRGQVQSLTVWSGDLCAGDGVGYVECYDGSTWTDLSYPRGAQVTALAVWSGMICAGDNDGYVQCYNGASWQDLGDLGENVQGLVDWNGELCEGNSDDHVRCYDGSNWRDLGDLGENVNDLAVWDGQLCQGNQDQHVTCYLESLISDGNFGIGTTSPARKLHIDDAMRLEPRASAPLSPSEGDMYMDSSDHKLKVYDGTTWQACW
jgi:hypothetical protein